MGPCGRHPSEGTGRGVPYPPGSHRLREQTRSGTEGTVGDSHWEGTQITQPRSQEVSASVCRL